MKMHPDELGRRRTLGQRLERWPLTVGSIADDGYQIELVQRHPE